MTIANKLHGLVVVLSIQAVTLAVQTVRQVKRQVRRQKKLQILFVVGVSVIFVGIFLVLLLSSLSSQPFLTSVKPKPI
jgi:uncharacterized membrane protein YidH (DUF202 family)